MGGSKASKERRKLLRAGLDPNELVPIKTKEAEKLQDQPDAEQKSGTSLKKKERAKRKREKKKLLGADGAKTREEMRRQAEVQAKAEAEEAKQKKKHEGKEAAVGCDDVAEADHVSKKRRRKAKNTEAAEGEGQAPCEKFIVFVGQLPYTADAESLQEHFENSSEILGKVAVRLLTEKGTQKPKGMAFVELASNADLLGALKLHNTEFAGRRINVERSKRGKKDLTEDDKALLLADLE